MSSPTLLDLNALSQALTSLVNTTSQGIVALKAAPYRVVSGVVLPGNLIATTAHTLRREKRIPFRTAGAKEGEANILGHDASVDVAILKAAFDITPLPTADENTFQTGSLIAVVGYTFDVGPSASLGIVGAKGESRRTWRGGTLDRFIRLDATVYPSQAGAAVVTHGGHLVGMATNGLLRHSAMAVPVSTLTRVADELLREGRIRHGYMGVGVQPVSIPAALQNKLDKPQLLGLIVLSVEDDCPAAAAGIQISDILLSLNNHSLESIEDLQRALRGDIVGTSTSATILRGGERLTLQVKILERPRKEK